MSYLVDFEDEKTRKVKSFDSLVPLRRFLAIELGLDKQKINHLNFKESLELQYKNIKIKTAYFTKKSISNLIPIYQQLLERDPESQIIHPSSKVNLEPLLSPPPAPVSEDTRQSMRQRHPEVFLRNYYQSNLTREELLRMSKAVQIQLDVLEQQEKANSQSNQATHASELPRTNQLPLENKTSSNMESRGDCVQTQNESVSQEEPSCGSKEDSTSEGI